MTGVLKLVSVSTFIDMLVKISQNITKAGSWAVNIKQDIEIRLKT